MSSVDVARLREALPGLPEGQRELLEAKLAELGGTYHHNPLEAFNPFPKQCEYLASRDRQKMFAGGNQSGKTTVGVVDDIVQCLPEEFVPPHLKAFKFWTPPFLCRTIIPGYKLLETGVLEKTRELVPSGALLGGNWKDAFDKTNLKLRFANGSWIDYMSYEAEVDKFGSVTLDRVRFDEEPKGDDGRQIYNQSLARTMARRGQICFTMTPLFGLSWTKEEVWDRRGQEGYFGVKASMFDNPTLDPNDIEVRYKGLTKEERLSIVEGEFSHFEGKVFDDFDERIHVCKAPEREHVRQLDTVCSIDPGIRWTGLTWTAFDSDNSAVVYVSVVLDGSTVENTSREIRKVNDLWGVSPFYVIDPSARNRVLTNAEQVEGAFMRERILVSPGQNALEAGVFEIKRRLQHQVNEVPEPMLRVSVECQRLLWEIGRYRQSPKPDGSFAVVKQDDHCLDSLRYALMERPWMTGPPVKERRRHGWVPGTAPPQGTFVSSPMYGAHGAFT